MMELPVPPRSRSSEKDSLLSVDHHLNVRIVLWPKYNVGNSSPLFLHLVGTHVIIAVLEHHSHVPSNSARTLKAWRGFKDDLWEWPDTVKEALGIPISDMDNKPASWTVCIVLIPLLSQQGEAKLKVKLEKVSPLWKVRVVCVQLGIKASEILQPGSDTSTVVQ